MSSLSQSSYCLASIHSRRAGSPRRR